MGRRSDQRRRQPQRGRDPGGTHQPLRAAGANAPGTDAEAAFTRSLRPIPVELRKCLTYDPGKEMARQEELTRRLSLPVYFADLLSPWQRPTNENTNGLIRQYLPKGQDPPLRGVASSTRHPDAAFE